MTPRLTFAAAALAALLASPLARAESQNASLDDYRHHLTALTTLVAACAKARDAKACDPEQVGPDDTVPLGPSPTAESRPVRYGWLRSLLAKAQDKDPAPEKEATKPAPKPAASSGDTPSEEATLPPPRTTAQLLEDAQARLAQDLHQADTLAQSAPAPAHTQERAAMRQVLAGKEFRNLDEPSTRDSLLEKVGDWLNRLMESVTRFGPRAAWVGRVIVWGFILAICVGLVWGLLQLERRWRLRLVPDNLSPAAGAASARDWQLWLADARSAAAQGQWREAIHFVYWASISRLESRRLWPADRARTPREYLALVAPEDPRQPGLSSLTSSFERVWYGGRPAAESDYRHAEGLATALIAAGGAA